MKRLTSDVLTARPTNPRAESREIEVEARWVHPAFIDGTFEEWAKYMDIGLIGLFGEMFIPSSGAWQWVQFPFVLLATLVPGVIFLWAFALVMAGPRPFFPIRRVTARPSSSQNV